MEDFLLKQKRSDAAKKANETRRLAKLSIEPKVLTIENTAKPVDKDADKKRKKLEKACDTAQKYYADKFEYTGKIGIERMHPDYVVFFAREPKIEEAFRINL